MSCFLSPKFWFPSPTLITLQWLFLHLLHLSSMQICPLHHQTWICWAAPCAMLCSQDEPHVQRRITCPCLCKGFQGLRQVQSFDTCRGCLSELPHPGPSLWPTVWKCSEYHRYHSSSAWSTTSLPVLNLLFSAAFYIFRNKHLSLTQVSWTQNISSHVLHFQCLLDLDYLLALTSLVSRFG